MPVYFKLVDTVSPTEVLAHRIVWAIPFGAMIIFLRNQWPEVRRALTHGKMRALLALAAIMIAINWFVYVWAIQDEQVFQASLGYYINPMLYVVVGVFFFGEKLRSLQKSAVVLATIGVLILALSGGRLPWIALTLASSFTIYGIIRKQVVVGAMPGLFVETVLLLPFAIAWLVWLTFDGQIAFFAQGTGMSALLLLAGPFTVIPLLFFAIAARRVSLATIGFMQFLAPTLQFCVGVYYGEALTVPHLICFGFIWVAVLLFSADAIRTTRKALPASGH